MAKLTIYFLDNHTEVEIRLSMDDNTDDQMTIPLHPTLVDKGGVDPALENDLKNNAKGIVPKGGVDIHFDTLLVTSIDKILKKNRMDILSLSEVEVGGNANESSSAYQIVQTVVKAIKIK